MGKEWRAVLRFDNILGARRLEQLCHIAIVAEGEALAIVRALADNREHFFRGRGVIRGRPSILTASAALKARQVLSAMTAMPLPMAATVSIPLIF